MKFQIENWSIHWCWFDKPNIQYFFAFCPNWLPLFSPLFHSNCIAAINHSIFHNEQITQIKSNKPPSLKGTPEKALIWAGLPVFILCKNCVYKKIKIFDYDNIKMHWSTDCKNVTLFICNKMNKEYYYLELIPSLWTHSPNKDLPTLWEGTH